MKTYPEDYKSEFEMKDGTKVVLRPIEPEDFDMEKEMFSHFSKETQRLRFFTYINEVTPEMIKRYTNVNHTIEVGIMAEVEVKGKKKMAGVVRLISDAKSESGEIAIVVADPWQRKGLGNKFLSYIIAIAQKQGLHKIYTFILPDNYIMEKLLKKKGFRLQDKGDHIFVEKNI